MTSKRSNRSCCDDLGRGLAAAGSDVRGFKSQPLSTGRAAALSRSDCSLLEEESRLACQMIHSLAALLATDRTYLVLRSECRPVWPRAAWIPQRSGPTVAMRLLKSSKGKGKRKVSIGRWLMSEKGATASMPIADSRDSSSTTEGRWIVCGPDTAAACTEEEVGSRCGEAVTGAS